MLIAYQSQHANTVSALQRFVLMHLLYNILLLYHILMDVWIAGKMQNNYSLFLVNKSLNKTNVNNYIHILITERLKEKQTEIVNFVTLSH